MKMLKTTLFLLALTWGGQAALGQVTLTSREVTRNDFALVRSGTATRLHYDLSDHVVVGKAVQLFSEDILRVSGRKASLAPVNAKLTENNVVVGTLGSNRLIDEWARQGKLSVQELKGKWEAYTIQVVHNPVRGVKKVLVIAGSDRRGTAYGVFTLSELMGVSPWYWWADVPVAKRRDIFLKVTPQVSKSPSVKYRGVFINDEDWGLLPWAKKTFEPERGTIGPKTYARVCELLLRLKANYLCPAMHEATTAFNQIPENKRVADSFAIVMGSVHSEPLLFNNASEWDRKTMGEWDYINNKETIQRVLRERVQNNAAYENVYTLALRGLHDRAMAGSSKMSERVAVVSQALRDQRRILAEVLGRPAPEIPQAFTPYKEVLDLYTHGLDLPEDVTIVWPDDNYGYMKQLSSPAEQQRSGRSGVYYHASYLGKPHDYLWIASTPPALMYEELSKAYSTTADRLWLLNAGDIKSCELPVTLFLAMAYDMESFSYERVANFPAEWLARQFGSRHFDAFRDITQTYYHLAFARKPEHMGWGYEWNTNKHPRERTTDTDFSFAHYGEADRRLAAYHRIAGEAAKIMEALDGEAKASFYQLVYYPVTGAALMNKMHLLAQKNRSYALEGRSATNELKAAVTTCYDSLQLITKGYNELLGGKWRGIMQLRQGGPTTYYEHPKVDSLHLGHAAALDIRAEGEEVLRGARSFHALPAFNTYLRTAYYVDVFNKGTEGLTWKATPSHDWIQVSRSGGFTRTEERLWVSIDWSRVPTGEKLLGSIEVSGAGTKEQVLVSVFNPSHPTLADMDSLYVEHNGYISIPADGYHRKVENDHIQMRRIPNLGVEHTAVQLGDPTAPQQNPRSSTVPALEYDFYAFGRGSVDVYTYTLPTFPLYPERGYAGHESNNVESTYGVCLDDGPVMTPATSSFEYAQTWYESVLRNCRVNKTTLHLNGPGKHTLKILTGDAGVVVQKIVLDFGGLKRSYLGPPSTRSLMAENLDNKTVKR